MKIAQERKLWGNIKKIFIWLDGGFLNNLIHIDYFYFYGIYSNFHFRLFFPPLVTRNFPLLG